VHSENGLELANAYDEVAAKIVGQLDVSCDRVEVYDGPVDAVALV
jgi:hypothetical protein